jgi:hypothetical protein
VYHLMNETPPSISWNSNHNDLKCPLSLKPKIDSRILSKTLLFQNNERKVF